MELIEPDTQSSSGALPEPEPRYHTAALPAGKTEHGQTWVRIAASIILGVIIIALIVLSARWVYHKARNNAEPKPSAGQNTPAASSSNRPANPAPSRPQSSSSGTSNPAVQPSQLSNTGPGDVAAIFVGASLAAGGLHYLISVRRFAKN